MENTCSSFRSMGNFALRKLLVTFDHFLFGPGAVSQLGMGTRDGPRASEGSENGPLKGVRIITFPQI